MRKRRTGLAPYMSERAHYEIAKASPQVNIAYCSKEHAINPAVELWKFGNIEEATARQGQSGRRTDLEDALSQAGSLANFMDNNPVLYCQYKSGVTALMQRKAALEVKVKPICWWIWGATGAGKTRFAVQFSEENHYQYWISGENLKWFDGYEG